MKHQESRIKNRPMMQKKGVKRKGWSVEVFEASLLRGQSKIIASPISDNIVKLFFNLLGRSGMDLGGLWDHPGPIV